MKAFYANENYAKYGYKGVNYFMALMAATIYIMLTVCMILFIVVAIFPTFNKYVLGISSKIPTLPSAIVTLGLVFFILRITINEESLKDGSFSKAKVNKAVNYLLAYAFIIILVIGFIGLKFLRH